MHENEIATIVLDACFVVHRALGPGLFESVHEEAVADELSTRRVEFGRQVEIPVQFRGHDLGIGFRADLIVCKLVVVEFKSVESIVPIHKKQLLNYLKLAGLRLGLLVNFNVPLLRDGITRLANRLT
ncbi:MAG: GxxExxY protein [Bacteroidetes bacterium]|jgi:GxxExxY protein|nr:GxxExxY protein [Bacteroidota bacterium]